MPIVHFVSDFASKMACTICDMASLVIQVVQSILLNLGLDNNHIAVIARPRSCDIVAFFIWMSHKKNARVIKSVIPVIPVQRQGLSCRWP